MQQQITQYITEINKLYKAGITTEHSFRGALETLLKNMTGYQVVNEAQHIACGAPDLTLLKNNIPVGYVEAKDIGKNLNSKDYKNQFDRYKKALDNLIITDYLTFQLFEGEEFITEIKIGETANKGINPLAENFNKFIELIRTFSQYNGKSIANSKQLAEFMAAKTQLLAEVIEKTLNDESTLRAQLQDFQEVLLPTMDNAQFADMYAQTIAYGMFVARLQDNSTADFSRQQAANLIPKSNPFLRKLFQYIAGYDIDENICWIVDSLADMFNYVDIDAIHHEFESKDKDPFLHFYEDFLTRYDKNLKNAKGAYYTPSAVVKFIVNAVDDILKTDFNLTKGLADNSKLNIDNKEYHKVQILDPATGTGTFLAEVVRNIYQKFANNAGVWDDYVRQHLIPRLNGFEIMMSPYTMAHLKIETILQEFGHNAADNQRLRIYLTDSLEEPKQSVQRLGLYKWLSDEATEAAKIKNNVPVMVILGNPPYSGESQNKGEWILRLMEDYKKEPAGGRLQEKNPKWLNDDYAKFIRFGQYFVEKNGEGVLAYINNHSFLDNPTFRGMRYNLLKTFDKIYIIDLHGNSKKKETAPNGGKDENVFDIQQGVSINIFVKTGKENNNSLAEVFHYDIFGKRNEKYGYLIDNNLNSIDWQKLNPESPFYFFVPKNSNNREEYEKGFLITDLFSVNSVGIGTYDDDNLVSFSTFSTQNNHLYTYRPFDTRFINYDLKKVKRSRYSVMRNMLYENLGLIVGRQGQAVGNMQWSLIFISNKLVDLNVYYRGGGTIFPLYLYQETFGQTEKVVNLNAAIVAKFPSFGGVPEGWGGRNTQNYMQLPYNPQLKERARELRKAGNLSEVLFWNRVKNKQFKGYDFDRQKIVGNYIVDFFCTNCNVVIEIDGSSHDDKQEYDAARDAFLQSVGLTVIHIPDMDVKKRLDEVMEMLHSHEALQPPPNPSKGGEFTTPSFGHPSKGGESCPEQIFDYIYAILHSPSYRERYKEFLKIDFPRIPYPENAEQFNKLATFGEQLRHLHLMETSPNPSKGGESPISNWRGAGGEVANFPVQGSNEIEKPIFTRHSDESQNPLKEQRIAGQARNEGKVFINDIQYFDNVPEIAWNFYIGGYQPAQKWLKDRRKGAINRALTYEDIQHYQKIIFVLSETDRIMKEIDELFIPVLKDTE